MVFLHETDMKALTMTCPPSNAKENDVEPVYRFIENDTVQEIDFKTHKARKKKYPPFRACDALALSFYTTEEAVGKAAEKFEGFKEKK